MHDTAPEAGEGTSVWTKLYRLRMRHNYTQKFVAEALDVAPSTLCRWEKEPDKMHIDDLRKAAEFYKVSAEWLLTPDPLVLHMHDNQMANGAYNTVNVMPQEMIAQYNAHIEVLHKLTERLMDLLGEKTRKAE
jgi:transcriptional regulator with XRE-family HTH domain